MSHKAIEACRSGLAFRPSRLSRISVPRQYSSRALSTKVLTSIPPGSFARRAEFCKASLFKGQWDRVSQLRHCSYHRKMCRKDLGDAGDSMDVTKGREVLPTNAKPLHYDVTLEPNFEKFTYEGTVVIEYVPRGHRGSFTPPSLSRNRYEESTRTDVGAKQSRDQGRQHFDIPQHAGARHTLYQDLICRLRDHLIPGFELS